MPDCPIHNIWLYENTAGSHGYCPKCEAWFRIETRAIKSSKSKVHPDSQIDDNNDIKGEGK